MKPADRVLIVSDVPGGAVEKRAELLPEALLQGGCPVRSVTVTAPEHLIAGGPLEAHCRDLTGRSLVLLAFERPFGQGEGLQAQAEFIELAMPSAASLPHAPGAELVPLPLIRAALERQAAARLGPVVAALRQYSASMIAVAGVAPPWSGRGNFAKRAWRQLSQPVREVLLDRDELQTVKVWLLHQQAIHRFCRDNALLFAGTSGTVPGSGQALPAAAAAERPERRRGAPGDKRRPQLRDKVQGAS